MAPQVAAPLLVRSGLANWKRKIVPVGRSLIRLPRPVNAFSEIVGGFADDVIVLFVPSPKNNLMDRE